MMISKPNVHHHKLMQGPHYLFSDDLVEYEEAQQVMQQICQEMKAPLCEDKGPVTIWFLEHPPVYTAGISAKEKDLLSNNLDIPVVKTNRGGQYTYHGPGQLVVYCMCNLNALNIDARVYVKVLENWVIRVLDKLNVKAFLDPQHIGVWVKDDVSSSQNKIAALGVRVSKGVTTHGIALNYAPDLRVYQGIVPCGISKFGVTSLENLGVVVTREELRCVFQDTLPVEFCKK